MRAHDPPDRDVPTHSARTTRPTRPGTGSEPLTGSVTAILALQQQAGNAAVARTVQRLRSGHDPDQGQTDGHEHEPSSGQRPGPEPEPVQRSAVHKVLRSAGRPLDEPTRADMEARLGADFSDVRLHTGTLAQRSAAEVGAQAYTSGSHVVIGQGGADRHTLAHELTHVIQQRSGPVAGTDNGHGLRISDPGDAYERAAEANAHRALAERPAQPETRTAAEPAGPPSGNPAVQRITEDELHREPPGPSVRVRGPRKSKAKNKATTQVQDDLNWRAVSEAYRATTGQTPDKERISLDRDLASLIDMSPNSAGRHLGAALSTVAEQEAGIPPSIGDHHRTRAEMVEQLGRLDPLTRPYWEAQSRRDRQLATDAVTRDAQYQQESGAENAHALRDATAPMLRGIPRPAINTMGTLLQANDGLVIGGDHKGFFPWATTHMVRLRQNGVRTLYIEAFRDDAHQRLIDAYLSSGQMSSELTNFCNNYQGEAVDLAAFLEAARSVQMRVKGTGGHPARSLRPSEDDPADRHRRVVMQNTYGEQVIRRDRRQLAAQGVHPPGKYLVEAGEAHARTHTNTATTPVLVDGVPLPHQFPGINELLGVPAVRLDDNHDGSKRLRPI